MSDADMSKRLRNFRWSFALILAINLAGVGAVYWLTWTPVQNAFDQSLTDAAWALVPQIREADGRIQIDLPQRAKQILRIVHFDDIYFVVRDDEDRLVAGDSDFPVLLMNDRSNDVRAYDAMMRDQKVRVTALHTVVGSHIAYIGVAETMHKRNQLRSSIALSLLALVFTSTTASCGLLWFLRGKQ
jgi:two-component system sensor histidine kinase TctE